MKNRFFILSIFAVLINSIVYAQAPKAFRFQAQARDANGQAVGNKQVKYRISIVKTTIGGTTVYQETHQPVTDNYGIANLNIGQGIPLISSFNLIDWGADSYFVKQELDINNGNTFVVLGTTQLMSVPYALYAQNAVDVLNKLNDLEMKLYKDGVFTVKDVDGNVYKTIKIGTQIWMAENLKTTRYNDGVSVTYVSDNTTWRDLSTQAMCWYDNNHSNKALFGGLYNWYAVNTQKLCPTGWHVPSSSEWNTLTSYVNNAKALASTSGWTLNATVGTIGNNQSSNNSTGFNVVAAGFRFGYEGSTGACDYKNDEGDFWSSTSSDTTNAVDYLFHSTNSSHLTNSNDKNYGFSVRCVKD